MIEIHCSQSHIPEIGFCCSLFRFISVAVKPNNFDFIHLVACYFGDPDIVYVFIHISTLSFMTCDVRNTNSDLQMLTCCCFEKHKKNSVESNESQYISLQYAQYNTS